MDKGANKLGEFSLTDKRFSKINVFMANTLFDENYGGKYGNCHIAVGASYSDSYAGDIKDLSKELKKKLGFNDSALHWDLVNTERKRVSAHLVSGETIAIYENGNWGSWEIIEYDPAYQVGELHITADGEELYFHSSRPGSLGANDIWVSRMLDGTWGEPENLTLVNSEEDDSRPFLSEDEQQLWITRTYKGTPAVFVSYKENGVWQEPVLIVSQFAGEPSLDNEGNLYFVHHFFWEGVMLDADIYLAKKK